MTVIVPLLLPETGEMVIHEALLPAVQSTLEVMTNESSPPFASKNIFGGETVSLGVGSPAW